MVRMAGIARIRRLHVVLVSIYWRSSGVYLATQWNWYRYMAFISRKSPSSVRGVLDASWDPK